MGQVESIDGGHERYFSAVHVGQLSLLRNSVCHTIFDGIEKGRELYTVLYLYTA